MRLTSKKKKKGFYKFFLRPDLAQKSFIALLDKNKVRQRFYSLYSGLLCASETLPNLFFQLGDTHEVSQLLLGQKTGNTTQLKAGS